MINSFSLQLENLIIWKPETPISKESIHKLVEKAVWHQLNPQVYCIVSDQIIHDIIELYESDYMKYNNDFVGINIGEQVRIESPHGTIRFINAKRLENVLQET